MLDEKMYNTYLAIKDDKENKEHVVIAELLQDLLSEQEFTFTKEDVVVGLLTLNSPNKRPYSKYQQAKFILALFDTMENLTNHYSIDYYAKKKGISFIELSEKVNISTRGLLKIRKGEVNPSQETINQLAKALGVKPEEIRTGI
ncbi:helix-turn-helix domain-containing protein [Streptococcus agalactiae]